MHSKQNPMRVYQGKEHINFPIKKITVDNEWLCQLTAGNIRVMVNFEEFEVTATPQKPVYFIAHDGQTFHIASGSRDFELTVYPISRDMVVTLYPYLGSEANASLYYDNFITSAQMGAEINQMLSVDFQQLQLLSRAHNLLERDKMHLHLLIHFYLTFYNGIGRVGSQTGSQSFDLVNRFYELFSERESYLHRDTQYFADKLNITVRYLFQVCKNETGRTPKELINDTIVSEIRHTMLTTKLSFQQISLQFNFPDQTAFTQFFKRNTGMTPSEFKQKYK